MRMLRATMRMLRATMRTSKGYNEDVKGYNADAKGFKSGSRAYRSRRVKVLQRRVWGGSGLTRAMAPMASLALRGTAREFITNWLLALTPSAAVSARNTSELVSCGGGSEGTYRSSLDARKPQNPTK
eukprot:8917380-Pyramimonas_sp.AAC.1